MRINIPEVGLFVVIIYYSYLKLMVSIKVYIQVGKSSKIDNFTI